MKYNRTLRISEEIKKIVSQIICFEIKDPRVSELTSVTRVETTNDLRYTTIYVTVHDEEEMAETLQGLNSAKSYIRRAIGKELNMHYTPEPLFKEDKGVAESIRMSQLIEQIKKADDNDKDA